MTFVKIRLSTTARTKRPGAARHEESHHRYMLCGIYVWLMPTLNLVVPPFELDSPPAELYAGQGSKARRLQKTGLASLLFRLEPTKKSAEYVYVFGETLFSGQLISDCAMQVRLPL